MKGELGRGRSGCRSSHEPDLLSLQRSLLTWGGAPWLSPQTSLGAQKTAQAAAGPQTESSQSTAENLLN